MIEKFLRRPWVIAQLRTSVFGTDMELLAGELERLGYTTVTIQNHLHAAGHVAHWMERRRIPVSSLDESMMRQFAAQHLRHCRCHVPRATGPDVRGVAPHLLKLLRARGRVPHPIVPALTPTEMILDAFRMFLRDHRGAVQSTWERHAREIRPLLKTFSFDRSPDLSWLTVGVLRAHVLERARHVSPRTVRCTASALRGFLRFLNMQGLCDASILSAVPSVSSTQHSLLPQPITSAELEQLLTSIDRTRPVGMRDYAMLLCLARLGMRAKEVAGLRLDDIDWRNGTVTIVVSKSRRASVLPLPGAVGRAVSVYLRRGRPATATRFVFVRHLFPKGKPVTSQVVSMAVQHAFRRSGLIVPSHGAHTLRHTAATEMVRGGASLKAVADVLRHQSIDTTAIYTKIDVPRLREVALPWPEPSP